VFYDDVGFKRNDRVRIRTKTYFPRAFCTPRLFETHRIIEHRTPPPFFFLSLMRARKKSSSGFKERRGKSARSNLREEGKKK
jgi:hypothetical protein